MTKLIDLTGKTFNEWYVISRAPSSKYGETMWDCRCSCGKLGIVRAHDLKSGNNKSCGHDRKRTIKDIKGKVFGDLKVLKYFGESKWTCLCSCGKILNIRSHSLTSGHTKSCGHDTTGFKDIKGQVFGEWEVLEYVGEHFWMCKCSCGKISKVHSYSLRNGWSKSCGHSNISKKLENLEGMQFGEWSVLNYLSDSTWECKCSCGKISKVAAYDLKQGNSKNCGHNRKTPYKDLTGMIFGYIKVVKYLYKNKYLCECSCGTQKELIGSNLLSGNTISCGCKNEKIYNKEYVSNTIQEYKEINGEAPFTIDIAKKLGISTYFVNLLLSKHELKHLMDNKFGSNYEREIYNIVMKSVPEKEIIISGKTILTNKEIDIYIPSKKLAIEFNGTFWHNADRVGSKYHQQKTIDCAKKGIQLIHIFEHEWKNPNTNKKLIKLIQNKLNNSNIRIVQARKCVIKQVNTQNERYFLNEYHLQNYTPSRIAYGLYLDKELLSIMTFGSQRFSKHNDWELIRYCSKDDTAVIGGAEKLFNTFIRRYKPNSIVSYCNVSKFFGNVYKKLGFTATVNDLTEPNYVWVNYALTDVLTRYQTQKKKLLSLGYGEYGDTEDSIMKNRGYMKIYDSGNMRFKWEKH